MTDAEFLDAMEARCAFEKAFFKHDETVRARQLAGLPKGPLSTRLNISRIAMLKYVRIAKKRIADKVKKRMTE